MELSQTHAQTIWRWPISLEAFLSSTAAGLFIFGALAFAIHLPGVGKAAFSIFSLSTILVILSLVVLLGDLGKKNRAMKVFRNWKSPMTIGAMLMTAFACLSFVSMVAEGLGLLSSRGSIFELLLLVGAVLGFGVLLYPGILFYKLNNIPFWNTIFLPMLFVFSGAASGSALGVFAVHGSQMIIDFTMVSLALYGASLLVFLLKNSTSKQIACKESMALIVRGNLSVHFWIGVVIVGLVAPFVLYGIGPAISSVVPLFGAGACTIVGCLFMRHVLLASGVPEPMRLGSGLIYPRMRA